MLLPQNFTLISDRLNYRHITLNDIDPYRELMDDELLARNASRIPFPFTREIAEENIQNRTAKWAAGEEFSFGTFTKDDATLVGHASIFFIEGNWSLGYGIHEKHRQLGYATEIARTLCAFAFEHLNVSEIHAGHFDDNPASENVLRKTGFVNTDKPSNLFSIGRNAYAPGTEYILEKNKFAQQ